MKKKETTIHEKLLFEALIKRGHFAVLNSCDTHKCVDIRLPNVRLNIEVDGKQHYTNPEQIIADIDRDNYSQKDGFDTIRIPNVMIEKNLKSVVKAISQVASRRKTLQEL